MLMPKNPLKLVALVIAVLAGISLVSCTGKSAVNEEGTPTVQAEAQAQTDGAAGDPGVETYPEEIFEAEYLSLVDGLHVTGTPVKVDIDTYRLKVEGAVENPLALSFEEIQAMEAQQIYAELNCPGFFTDAGYWTGVPVRDILAKAGVSEDAAAVAFIALGGSYRQQLPLDLAQEDGFLIAYKFNDKIFPPVHGYPLRLVAKGEPGSTWVKWLGELRVD